MNKISLHPIVSLLFFVCLIIPSILFSSPLFILLLFIAMMSMLFIIDGLKKLKSIVLIFFFFFFVSLIVNFIFTNVGSTVIFQITDIPIINFKRLSVEMVVFTFVATMRLVYIFSVFSISSYISSEDRMLSFFSKIFRNFPLLLSFTIRLIPKLTSDYKRLEYIFRLRGFETVRKKEKKRNSIIGKLRNMINPKLMLVLIRTLLMNSLEDSVQYAESMQARGYGSFSKRSLFFEEKLSFLDFIISFISIIYLLFSFITFSFSIGTKDIYPLFKLSNYVKHYDIIALIIMIALNSIIYLVFYFIKTKKASYYQK